MKIIGMVGGLSWQSSVEYYRVINEESNKRLGFKNTAKSIMYTVNLEEMLGHMGRGEQRLLEEKFLNVCRTLEAAGAGVVLICSNTMHITAPYIEKNLKVPLLHIADTTAVEMQKRGITKVGLLGTPFTMDMPFYKNRVTEKYGIEVITPDKSDYDEIYRVITDELTFGVIKESSRANYLRYIDGLSRRGAQGVILGCTEIPLLIKQEHCYIPVLDTTELHALAAVDAAFED
jgi:aspartate racemase